MPNSIARTHISKRSHGKLLPRTSLLLLAAATILCILSAAAARAQVSLPSFPSPDTTQSTTSDDGAAASQSPNSSNLENSLGPSLNPGMGSGGNDAQGLQAAGGGQSLSAGAIINFLEENPDVTVELKSLAADRLQQQGGQLDANDISDEALYQQIETSASLRASITTFLRARGYTVQDDQQTSSAADVSSDLSGAQRPSSYGNSTAGTDSALRSDTASRVNSLGSPSGVSAVPQARRGASTATRPAQAPNASTDAPQVLRRPTPYNLRSMRDLYTQIPAQTAPLKRFGSDVFLERRPPVNDRNTSSLTTPLDIPLGPDYVVGPGDTLEINLWGGVTQRISRLIGPDGRILLPEAGSVQVAGLTLERAQSLIEGVLKPQYRNVQLAVTIARLRSVRIYVVGDVQRPGGYDLSSLATPITALYAAGGPTSAGSLRLARHLRGDKLIEEVDLYDFLLRGVRNGSARFESGDTLLVPPAGLQAAVSGAVRRPAIYELKAGESTLSQLVEDAGGLLPSASLSHIVVERIAANQQRETLSVPHAENAQPGHDSTQALSAFTVKDGDRIRIEPILPYSERAIYVEGHVVRPGRVAYREGMHLSDVLRSYRDLLPEPAARGEIVRLVAPDLHAETIAFNLPDVLIGNANLDLEPFDTIRVLSRYEADAPRVTISGEVLRPGSYPLSSGMTVAQLVRMAGGFKRDALRNSADLTSYEITGDSRVVAHLTTLPVDAAVSGADPKADAVLKPGDVLAIHQITGWNDIGQSITIEGQVRFPGAYGFTEGERLSSVLRRAGGLLPTAYPMGAVLVRDQVREVEQNSREELIRQIQANSAAARLSPNLGSGDPGATLQLIKAQQDQVLADLRSHPPSGRMVIHIDADIDNWANTPADIELRRGDVLTVPKRPGFVLVTGQVYNATALTFTPDKNAAWYLSRAGGTNATADRKQIFIIRANGSIVGRHSNGHFGGNVLSTVLNPGDVIVVPQKIIGNSLFWRNLLSTAQIASSIAITAAVASL